MADPVEGTDVNHDTPLKARPTTYKGIRMRSRTEAAYAARLDAASLAWEYEPRCFADETGQYLPDFRVTDRAVVAYVEVKGMLEHHEAPAVQRRMEIIWSSEPDAQLMLVVVSSMETYHAMGPGNWKRWITAPKPTQVTDSARVALGGRPADAARTALGGVRRVSLGEVRSAARPSPDGAA